jgi:hypothetical protein
VGHLCSVSIFEKGRYELETIVDYDAFGLSFGILGSTLLTYVSNDFMKPLLLVVLSFL